MQPTGWQETVQSIARRQRSTCTGHQAPCRPGDKGGQGHHAARPHNCPALHARPLMLNQESAHPQKLVWLAALLPLGEGLLQRHLLANCLPGVALTPKQAVRVRAVGRVQHSAPITHTGPLQMGMLSQHSTHSTAHTLPAAAPLAPGQPYHSTCSTPSTAQPA